jgi:hypothetical protein
MKSAPLVFLFFANMFSGCGGHSMEPVVASPRNVVLATWHFKATNLPCTMSIRVTTAPAEYGEAVIWHFSKTDPQCYWNYRHRAKLDFVLQKQADGSWASVHQTIACDDCLPGHTEGTTDNILEPGAYRIIPAEAGTTGDTGYHPCWQWDVLTMTRNLCSGSGLVPWRTDAYIENGFLVSEQWENCPDHCGHEKWYFTLDGKELERIVPSEPFFEVVRVHELDGVKSKLRSVNPESGLR